MPSVNFESQVIEDDSTLGYQVQGEKEGVKD